MRRVLPQDVDVSCPLQVNRAKADEQMREMYIDEFGRPVSPSMASQYSPPHEHMVPSWPLPPVLPYPPNTVPMSPPYGDQAQAGHHPYPAPSQYMPHPNFFPVYFGHPGQMGAPPPSPMAADGNGNVMGPQPGMWYQPPIGSSIPPFAHVSLLLSRLLVELTFSPKVKMLDMSQSTLPSHCKRRDLRSSPHPPKRSPLKSRLRLNSPQRVSNHGNDPHPFPPLLRRPLSEPRSIHKVAGQAGVEVRMEVH
jgi:hypothetical protein